MNRAMYTFVSHHLMFEWINMQKRKRNYFETLYSSIIYIYIYILYEEKDWVFEMISFGSLFFLSLVLYVAETEILTKKSKWRCTATKQHNHTIYICSHRTKKHAHICNLNYDSHKWDSFEHLSFEFDAVDDGINVAASVA